jgi:nucleoside-triphosphatase
MSVMLLTGRPGAGKTTVLRRAADLLRGWRLGGFYTEEIRTRGERRGFRAVSFDGRAWDLAHVEFRDAPARVGRYGVDVGVMDAVAATLRQRAVDVWFVDEIGRMECLSRTFVTAMGALLDGVAPVVATVAQRGGGLIAEVKRRPDAELRTVTRATRDVLPAGIADWVASQRAAPR